jgi:DNA invertase Pin-like site-specific DNA recombinase
MRQIFGSIAQYDRAMTVAKLRGARERMRAATGRCEGRKPYGERPVEREVIERMKAFRGEGLAVDTIATKLNSDSVMLAQGSGGVQPSVYRVLKAADAL